MLASDATLRITEVFCSLQGESTWAGLRTVFVRLTGCPLRCGYCDSAYAFHGGEKKSINALLEQVAEYSAAYVCVTGGEPLAQPGCITLLQNLCDAGFKVSLETSGALDIEPVDSRVKRIVDLKTPSSGEEQRNLYSNMNVLRASDEVKFVIANREDYDWAVKKTKQYQLLDKVAAVLYSPVVKVEAANDGSVAGAAGLQPVELAEWMLNDRSSARMQMQIHKLLWGDQPGH